MNVANNLPATTVKSAMRTLDIIEYVVAHRQGVVAQDVAAALAIPVSSLSYLLSTLVERNYLRRDGRRYLAGPGLDRLRAPNADLSLEEKVMPLVRGLRSELNETCSFMIRAGWDVEALVTEASAQALRYAIDVGSRRPMHCLAAGKAMLAALPDKELECYFEESERLCFTPFTLTGEAELRAELERIRQEGVAVASEETYPGVCGVACVARIGPNLVGAFAVAVPTVRYDTTVATRSRALLTRAAHALSEV